MSQTIQWGETADDAAHVTVALERLITGSLAAFVATEKDEVAAYLAELRGAATDLGLIFGPDADLVAELPVVLRAARDTESEKSELLVRAGDRRAAARHSGRRGWLDNAAYHIDCAHRVLRAGGFL